VAPAEWAFASNAFGRPEVANDHAQAKDISFNISHTNSLIVLGVARRRALGVDTENACHGQVPARIAGRFFAPDEVAALYALPAELQQRRFFEYWTLKESYIKARAMGLSLPLNKFSFQFVDDRQVAISIDRDQGDSPSRWRFWQLSIAGDYPTAVCVERLGGDVRDWC
jgi:4'-phosphopantetheinyl transferase